MEDREHPLEHEGLGPEQFRGYFPVFGGPRAGFRCAAAFFAACFEGGFHEEEGVVAGGGVGGEVGGYEEEAGEEGELGCDAVCSGLGIAR